jgi:hypothetical protein
VHLWDHEKSSKHLVLQWNWLCVGTVLLLPIRFPCSKQDKALYRWCHTNTARNRQATFHRNLSCFGSNNSHGYLEALCCKYSHRDWQHCCSVLHPHVCLSLVGDTTCNSNEECWDHSLAIYSGHLPELLLLGGIWMVHFEGYQCVASKHSGVGLWHHSSHIETGGWGPRQHSSRLFWSRHCPLTSRQFGYLNLVQRRNFDFPTSVSWNYN